MIVELTLPGLKCTIEEISVICLNVLIYIALFNLIPYTGFACLQKRTPSVFAIQELLSESEGFNVEHDFATLVASLSHEHH
jgi:hypothetical protein